jgi:ribosomal protein L4
VAPGRNTLRGVGDSQRRKAMEYVIQERFTNDRLTFEKAHSVESNNFLYFMRKDDSKSVFELIEKDRYEISLGQYKAAFIARMERVKHIETRLVEWKAQCKGCIQWECGHCGEPKYDLENELNRLDPEAYKRYKEAK